MLQLMVLATVLVANAFVSTSGALFHLMPHRQVRESCRGLRRHRLWALTPTMMDKIAEIKTKYETKEAALETIREDEERAAMEEDMRDLKVVVECDKALRQIEKDLAMFDDHLSGDDDKLKETAEVFKKEFTTCRQQLEEQLEKLLSEE